MRLTLLVASVVLVSIHQAHAQYYGGLPPPMFVPPYRQYGPPPGMASGYPPMGMPPMRCVTPAGVCLIPGGMPGGPCTCGTPVGPVHGQIWR